MIKRFIQRFMFGRYGADHLGVCTFAVSLVLYALYMITQLIIFEMLAWFVLFLSIYRFLSRNTKKRRAENDRFITLLWPIKRKIKLLVQRFKDRKSHKYFKCPGCGNMLRVPRGKGRIRITCPKCGERFEGKT